ncbi:MAG: hypothetical protein HKN23_14030 [Verrucomicrobiales bacterium]|nr:hypothetical protein [Verrucomicrobiales bacterium]
MPQSLVLFIYNLLLPFVLLLGFPSFLIKGIRRGGLVRNFRQRFGLYQPETKSRLAREGNFWIHAVSVGEILVAHKLIQSIQESDVSRPIVLSTTTTTGFALADEKFANSDTVTVIHNPVDLPWITASAIRKIQPEKLILVEAEVWPNLVRQVQKRGVPISLANARLSPRSEKRYHQFRNLVRPVFQMVDRVCVPFASDVGRWTSLGVTREKIAVTGSVKFDEDISDKPTDQIAELRAWLQEQGVKEGQPILLAGSTHAGEEQLIAKIWKDLKTNENFEKLALVIVPRHAERAGEIVDELNSAGIGSILRKRINRADSSNEPCLIANTTGELRAWFYLADVVVIGKSFIGIGGQNPVEPVMAGKPVIVGPNMQNFAGVMTDLVEAKGIVQLESADPAELTRSIRQLLENQNAAAEMAKRGQIAMNRHRGATERTVQALA